MKLVATMDGKDTNVTVALAPNCILPPAAGDTDLAAMVNVGGSRVFAVELLAPPVGGLYSPDLVDARIDGLPVTMQVRKHINRVYVEGGRRGANDTIKYGLCYDYYYGYHYYC